MLSSQACSCVTKPAKASSKPSMTKCNGTTQTPWIWETSKSNTNAWCAKRRSIADCSIPSKRNSTQSNSRINLSPKTSKRSEEHTSELQSRGHIVCRLLLENTNNLGISIQCTTI